MLPGDWNRRARTAEAESVARTAARKLLADEELVAMVSIGEYPDALRPEVLSELVDLIDTRERDQARANPRDW
jgi:hypothetical protein